MHSLPGTLRSCHATWFTWLMQTLLALAGLAAAAASMATPVFLGSSISATASGKAYYHLPTMVATESYAFDQPMGSHRVSAGVYSNYAARDAELLARQSIEASFNGGAMGTVTMQTAQVARNSFQGAMSLGGPAEGWHYRFQAEHDGMLHVHYAVEADPLVPNASPWSAFIISMLGQYTSAVNTGTEGEMGFYLTAGQTYEVRVGAASSEYSSVYFDVSRSAAAFFSWSIDDLPAPQAVPEPAAGALVLTALWALVVATARARARRTRLALRETGAVR
jgi:hypothetical protein